VHVADGVDASALGYSRLRCLDLRGHVPRQVVLPNGRDRNRRVTASRDFLEPAEELAPAAHGGPHVHHCACPPSSPLEQRRQHGAPLIGQGMAGPDLVHGYTIKATVAMAARAEAGQRVGAGG
jgi:hypothetical protein